jgi:hypothetical protein
MDREEEGMRFALEEMERLLEGIEGKLLERRWI